MSALRVLVARSQVFPLPEGHAIAVSQDSLDAPAIPELSLDAWLSDMQHNWRQGEHVLLLGQTGSGKTYLARSLLSIRDYVIVLAVKRHDDTLNQFRTAEPRYKVRRKWPPNYDENRVVIWIRAKSIDRASVREQALEVHSVLNSIYKNGGWCIFIDDTGYATGTLGLADAITVLFNQGRSSGISVVAAMTQASSVLQRIPTETMRQVRHLAIFYYEDGRDIDGIARAIGKSPKVLASLMEQLTSYSDGSTDFLAYDRVGRQLSIVHNAGGEG